MFKFTSQQLPVGDDPVETTDDAKRVLLKGEWGAANQAQPKLRHVHAGGCELTFRSTLVTLAALPSRRTSICRTRVAARTI